MPLPSPADLFAYNLFQYDAPTLQSLYWLSHKHEEISKKMTQVFEGGPGKFEILMLLVRDRYPAEGAAPVLERLWDEKGFEARWEDMEGMMNEGRKKGGRDEGRKEEVEKEKEGARGGVRWGDKTVLGDEFIVHYDHKKQIPTVTGRFRLPKTGDVDVKVETGACPSFAPQTTTGWGLHSSTRRAPTLFGGTRTSTVSVPDLVSGCDDCVSCGFASNKVVVDQLQPAFVVIENQASASTAKATFARDDPKATDEGAQTAGAAGATPTGTPSTVTSLPGSDAWIDLGGGDGASGTYKTLGPVPRAVMDFVARAAQKSDDEFGVHVNKIKAHFIDSDKVEVGIEIGKLLDQGLLYVTIDEQHVLPA